MWGLGIVLLMMLNGGTVPFGTEGPLAPPMPVDELQAQLDAHLVRHLQETSNDLVRELRPWRKPRWFSSKLLIGGNRQ